MLLPVKKLLPLATATVLGAAVLGASDCPGVIPERLPEGSWGGQHIGMVVTDTGATIQYDCALGTIAGPLVLDPSGAFRWEGVHYPGHGGPVRIDEPPNAHAAIYTGHATSDRLTLTLQVPDLGMAPQTFTLVRGGSAMVMRCL